MEVAKIQVGGTCACAYEKKTIRAGMVGVTVSFAFDEYWVGLNKIAVYRCGGVVRDEYLEGDTGTIPAEVLTKSGFDLEIGVYGTDAEKQIAIPTCWANLGVVRPGADPSGDPAADPSLPIWAQILAKLGNLADLSTEAKENLVAAINEALTKGGGEVDDEAIDAAVKKYLTADKMVISVNSKTGVVELAAEDVGADPAGSAADAVSQHNVATDSHADLRLELQNLADRVNAVLDSDDITLDELSEIVAYIKSNKTLIDAITTSKVSVTDIIDNLVTNVANKPLSAAQGVVLKGMIEEIRGLIPPAYTLPVGGNELGGVKNGGNVVINADGTMTAPEVSSGNGIAVTGATVGQTVKIAAVDEEGVPTAWEPVSFPGESGWTEIGTVTLQEDVGVWDDYIENVNPSFHSFDEVAILFHFTAAEGNTSQASASFKFRADNPSTFGWITIPYAIRTSGTFDFLVAFRKIGDLGGFVLGNSVVNVALASPKITGFNLYDGGVGKLYGAGSTATLIGRNVT